MRLSFGSRRGCLLALFMVLFCSNTVLRDTAFNPLLCKYLKLPPWKFFFPEAFLIIFTCFKPSLHSGSFERNETRRAMKIAI